VRNNYGSTYVVCFMSMLIIITVLDCHYYLCVLEIVGLLQQADKQMFLESTVSDDFTSVLKLVNVASALLTT